MPPCILLFLIGCDAARGLRVEVENPSDRPRPSANVTLRRDDLGPGLSLYDGATEIPLQVDDTLAFQVDLPPRGRKTLSLGARSGRPLSARAHAAVHPEFEGPGWESDLIAYRLYLDGRNAIDVFGKSEPGLGLDRYAKSGESYHDIHPWGVDVLHVGDTLGCGSFGFWTDAGIVKPVETLRTKPPSNALRRFVQIVADGPVRAIVRLTYDNWVVEGAPRTIRWTQTIWAGKRWTECELEVGPGWRPTVAVGVVAAKDIAMIKKDGFFYTWGIQSDPMSDTKAPEELGLGVLFAPGTLQGFVDEAPTAGALIPDDRSRVALLKPDEKGRVRWGYLAAWKRGSLGVRGAAAFESLCAEAAAEFIQPVTACVR